jgi:DeoR/GlpR family transcriptional regulator of sugar metabolism
MVDSSKFSSQAIFRICEMKRVTRVITDSGVSDRDRSQLEDLGVEVLVASPEDAA